MAEGRLFVISGPSAVGKGTIVKELLDADENLRVSVSATTRAPRAGETDGVSYYFLTKEEFKEKIDNGGFLEWAEVHGNFYGTPKAPVEKLLAEGKDVILEIDVQGAMQVKESGGEGAYIFILPPSMEELRNRINHRGTETEEAIALRMSKAAGEIAYVDRYDYFVINDDLQEAINTVKAIMVSEHQKINSKSAATLAAFKEVK